MATDLAAWGAMSTYEVDQEIGVAVSDSHGNHAVGAEIRWDSYYLRELGEDRKKWGSWSAVHWNEEFSPLGGPVLPSAKAFFEDQQVSWYVSVLDFFYLAPNEVDSSRQYFASDTVPIEIDLRHTAPSMVWGMSYFGAEVQLHDDNGWTHETYTGAPVNWPLGSKTGERTLTVCLPPPGPDVLLFCGTLSVFVHPDP